MVHNEEGFRFMSVTWMVVMAMSKQRLSTSIHVLVLRPGLAFPHLVQCQ